MADQISHKYRCLFIHIPKAGGTSVETSSLFDDQRNLTREYVGGHLKAKEYKQKYPEEFQNYFKFSFTRNPFDRLVSAFHHLSSTKFTNDYHKLVYEKIVSRYEGNFDYFCRDFVKTDNIYEIVHLHPQKDFILDNNDNNLLDFVGKLEMLNSDLNYVRSRIRWSGHVDYRLKSKHKHYSSYFSAITRNIVEEVYAIDLQRFKYSFEDALLNKVSYTFRDLSVFSYKFYPSSLKEKLNRWIEKRL